MDTECPDAHYAPEGHNEINKAIDEISRYETLSRNDQVDTPCPVRVFFVDDRNY